MNSNQYKVLVLTDHTKHSGENSLYDLMRKMIVHDKTASIDIASRANVVNDNFFNNQQGNTLMVHQVKNNFGFNPDKNPLSTDLISSNLADYDLVWLRMPPPLSKDFLDFISKVFTNATIINNPDAIYKTGSKEFLTNFAEVCPPLQVCKSLDDIIAFKKSFPIVLKPFRDYGGRGLVRIDGDQVWEGNDKRSFTDFSEDYKANPVPYLGVSFLKNVGLGDKRIVVVNGQVMGASLRLPPKDSWICNVAMGGTSNVAEVDDAEKEIVALIDPVLANMGIVMYGIDTLVDDDGKRVLSEINTTSIGGLPQIAATRNERLVEQAIDLIWSFYEDNKIKNT